MHKQLAKLILVFLTLSFILLFTNCPPPVPTPEPTLEPTPDPTVEPTLSPTPESKAYAFVKSLVNTASGMEDSSRADHTTTVYKNALAAMAFIHEGDVGLAEGIFNFFQTYYHNNLTSAFKGFRQSWDSQTGLPNDSSDYWEGDNAFLLLALDYYKVKENSTTYDELATALKNYLADRGDHDPDWYWANKLNADGLSDMYAALLPFKSEGGIIPDALDKIKNGFFIDYTGVTVLDHLHRAALVFGYVNDFNGTNLESNFSKTEAWLMHPEISVSAYSAFKGEYFINLEISAQVLNAWKIWHADIDVDLSGLQAELEKVWIDSAPDAHGLPYFLSYDSGSPGHGWLGCDSNPIVDSTCYMLYSDWSFNPFAPGEQCDRFMQATDRIEAARCYSSSGVQINANDVSNIDGGDWIQYKKIDFDSGAETSFVAYVCKGNDSTGTLEIRLDSTSGVISGTLVPTQTCTDWGTWQEQSTNVSGTTGVHDLYLTFTGNSGVCNIGWFKFQ